MESLDPRRRQVERRQKLDRHARLGCRDLGRGHAKTVRRHGHAVEAAGGVAEPGIAPGPDIGNDRRHLRPHHLGGLPRLGEQRREGFGKIRVRGR